MCVDRTDFRVQNHGRTFSSHKFNGKSGLQYEIGVGILTGSIHLIDGPYPCGEWNNIKIFQTCLVSFLDHGEWVEADDGYQGSGPWHVKCPSNTGNPAKNVKMQAQVRSRHETVNARFKNFAILADVYRHDITQHGYIFALLLY